MANRTQRERAIIDLVINGQQAKVSLKELDMAVIRSRGELKKLHEADNPELYKAKLAEFHKLLAAQKEMSGRINDSTTAWQRFKKEMATVAVGVVGGNVITFALQQLVALIPSTIEKTMKLRDTFADIEKATGLSAAGVKQLNKELKAIDTRTTNQELRDIAVAGGQLGVANNQLVDFVQNVDKAVVALGDEFTGGVDQVAKDIGGIAKLFDETRAQDIGPAINSIGSALNELGAAGSATSPVVAEFTTRMGQLGGLAPKLAETMGLGAAMQELGLSAEIAASGLSGLMLTASTQSDLFAQHLGTSKEAVEELINTSPNQFLMQLAESFRGIAPAQVAQRLKELKVESQESIKVMSLLANQTGMVREKQELAAKAMAEGTSLSEEAAKKNFQLAQDLKILNEWFNSLFTSEAVINFLTSAIRNAVEMIRLLPQLGGWLSKNAEYFYIIMTASLAYYAAVTKGTAALLANMVVEGYRKAAYELGFRWLVITTTAQSAYNTVMAATTVQARIATAAQLLWNGAVATGRTIWASFSAVLLANPIGLVIGALAGLVAAIKYFSENSERALRVEREKNSIQKQVKIVTEQHARAQQELNEKLTNYNDLSVIERANLEKTITLKLAEAQARLASLKARAHENSIANAELTTWERMKVAVQNPGASPQEYKRALFNFQRDKIDSTFSESLGDISGLEGEIKQYQQMQTQLQKLKNPNKAGTGKLNTITDPNEKKRQADKAATEAKRDEEELERMLADARKNSQKAEETDYERSVQAFADKYSKMYALAKNNSAKIKEIETLSLVEWAAIEKAFYEKQDEILQKEQEKSNKTGFDAALGEADQTREGAKESIGVDRANKKIGENEAHMLELEADQAFLTQKLLLEQTFAQNSADTQRQLTENWNEQVRLRAETEKNSAEQMKLTEWALQDAKRAAMAQGVEVLKGFLKENSLAYKAAIIAQKAFAIAQIVIDTQREIAGLAAAPATLLLPPGAREAYIATSATIAKVRAGIAIATIAATGYSEVAKKKDGGYTDIKTMYGAPSGYVNNETLFSLGRRSFIAGEAGREFVVSNKALSNPVVADFTRILDVAQRTNNYSLLTSGASGGAQPQSSAKLGTGGGMSHELGMAILSALERNNVTLESYAERPISFDMLAFERKQQDIQSIRTKTSL